MNVKEALQELKENDNGAGYYSLENCNHKKIDTPGKQISFPSSDPYEVATICSGCLKQLIKEKTEEAEQ